MRRRLGRWRGSKLRLEETQRIEEIRRSFEAEGWRLSVEDERDCWVAWFFQEEYGPVISDVVYRRTALGAALAAWEKFKGEPDVGGGLRTPE